MGYAAKEKATPQDGFGDAFCGFAFLQIYSARYYGGDERIRTSDQSFSPDAPLAGECLRPARPRLPTHNIYNDPQFNGFAWLRAFNAFLKQFLRTLTSGLAQTPYVERVQPTPYTFHRWLLKS